MSLKWWGKGSFDDEAEDRYDLVLAMSGLVFQIFLDLVLPVLVGVYFDKSLGAIWIFFYPTLIINFCVVMYWRHVMVTYYELKDKELAEELELEELNLNSKPTLSNVSFSSNAPLVGGNGREDRTSISRY